MTSYRLPDFHDTTPSDEISNRVNRLQKLVAYADLDAVLIAGAVNRFYFSGTMQDGYLLVPVQGNPTLMIRRNRERARAESPLEDVRPVRTSQEIPELVTSCLGDSPRRLGLELEILPVNLYRRFQSLWPHTGFEDASPAIMAVRAIKSEFEIGCMIGAGELARRVYAEIPAMLRSGLSELELAGMITRTACAGGHQDYLRSRIFNQEIYSWHVVSGPSGGVLSAIDAPFGGYGPSIAFPYGASPRRIEPGEPVLVDYGLCLNGYLVDLTRMFAVGKPPSRLIRSFEALMEIENHLTGLLRPGAWGPDLYRAAMDQANRLGFGHNFLGPPGNKAGFAGHGVGLENSDPPVLAPTRNEILLAGQTVALELKMVFPGLGAVGLENTYAVRNGEPLNLSPASPEFIMV